MKYRLVRKGDKYGAQFKGRFWWWYGLFVDNSSWCLPYKPTIRWVTKERACDCIETWKEDERLKKELNEFNRLPEIVCEQDDQCKGE